MKQSSGSQIHGKNSEFKQEISLFGGISIIGGIMIGSGIFYLGTYVLKDTNLNQGLALMAWLLGGLISMLGGICYAELGACDTRAGGVVNYLNDAFHPMVGFLYGFSSWILSGPASIAAVAIALPTNFSSFHPLQALSIKMIAVGLILILTLYNYFGVKQASKLQNVFMVAKVIPILLILLTGIILGKQKIEFNPRLFNEQSTMFDFIKIVGISTVSTLWAYTGWTNLNTVSEEIKNPSKNLPKAIIFAISSITVLYILFNYAIMKVLPLSFISEKIQNGDMYLGTHAAIHTMGRWGALVVTLGIVLSMLGALNGMILAFPRAYYAMSKEGHFFKSYKKIHPKYKVPYVSLIGQCIISVILVFFNSLEDLTSIVVFSDLLFNFLSILAVIAYRKKFPNLKRPYKIWGYPFTVFLSAASFFALMVSVWFKNPKAAVTGLLVPFVGCFFYFYFDKQLKKEHKK